MGWGSRTHTNHVTEHLCGRRNEQQGDPDIEVTNRAQKEKTSLWMENLSTGHENNWQNCLQVAEECKKTMGTHEEGAGRRLESSGLDLKNLRNF